VPGSGNSPGSNGGAVPPNDPGQFSSGRLLRGAPVHSGPSVSSDIVGYAAAGANLELVERKNGWAKVVDPATSRQGWIYEEHIAMTEGQGSVEEAAAQDDAEADEPAFKPNKARKKHAKKKWRKQLRFVLRFRR